MGNKSIERGDIVNVYSNTRGPEGHSYSIVEYLILSDGTVLNKFDDIITGYGERNTKIKIAVRVLWKHNRNDYWDDINISNEFDGETIIEVDPHELSIISKNDVINLEKKWSDKIKFLNDLFNNKPIITEVKQ